MALEIERRFLVSGEGWRNHAGPPQFLRQGYLSASRDGVTVRMRLRGEDQAWLTLKAPADNVGLTRHEFEYVIPVADAEALWELAPHRLEKVRHALDLPGGAGTPLLPFHAEAARRTVVQMHAFDPPPLSQIVFQLKKELIFLHFILHFEDALSVCACVCTDSLTRKTFFFARSSERRTLSSNLSLLPTSVGLLGGFAAAAPLQMKYNRGSQGSNQAPCAALAFEVSRVKRERESRRKVFFSADPRRKKRDRLLISLKGNQRGKFLPLSIQNQKAKKQQARFMA